MRRKIISLCFFLFVLISGLFAQTADSSKKNLPVKWMRSHKIDIQHIAIDLHFDWKKKQTFGTAAITFTPYDTAGSITLDAGMLTINSIVPANNTQLKFNYDGGDKNDGLEILLDRVYQPTETVTVIIDYHTNWVNMTDPNNLGGSDGKGIRFFEPSAAEPKRRRQIWSAGQPESNRYWFPCYDSPNDLRTTEFTATVDKKFTVISNGILVNTTNNTNGTHTFHYKMDMPYANYLTSFVIGEYVDIRQSHEDIQLHNFCYPEEAEAAAATVVRLPDMVRFYSELTGVKYPYQSYSQVFVQDAPWGIENITASTQSENMIDDERTHADFFYLWDGLEAEALAHQWFGNYLTCRDWSQVWLNRSFAHYFDGLYNEYKNGREEFLLWQVLGDQSIYLSNWNSGNRRPVATNQYENPAEFKTSDTYPYNRGALVLHMLRKHLGEEKWLKAIRLYVKSNANKLVVTEDLRKAVEEVSGEPMDWFFDQWLYKMGHPVFEITKKYDAINKLLILNVKQTQKIDPKDDYPQAEFFQGKMEIEVDGRIEQVWMEPKAENVFTFENPQQPQLVNVDYESTWIKEIKFDKPLDELLYQLQHDKDITGKRWALGELVNLAKNEKITIGDKAKIYEGFRNVILSNAYWRLKFIAMQQYQSLVAPSANTKPVALDETTVAMLLNVIKNERSWNRATAISFLGMTRDIKFAALYLDHFNDQSDRVINAAANALGKTKSPKAFEALSKLVSKPSWKNQSLISALNGLRQLEDKRGFDIAFKALSNLELSRWSLPTPVWDLRIAAAQTIAALGKADAAWPLIFGRFKKAMEEDDTNSIFNNVLLAVTLADPRAKEIFVLLKVKFKNDANAMIAVDQYEARLNDAIKK